MERGQGTIHEVAVADSAGSEFVNGLRNLHGLLPRL
jgi:hypothetical protein